MRNGETNLGAKVYSRRGVVETLHLLSAKLRRTRKAASQVWIVFLGTGPEADTLTVAAVTGSWGEADVLLHQGFKAFPDRSNEAASVPFTSGLTGTSESAIRPGEQRTVYVLAADEDWFEVFDSRSYAEKEREQRAGRGHDEGQVVEVVTNTWVGVVGSDPRLHRDRWHGDGMPCDA